MISSSSSSNSSGSSSSIIIISSSSSRSSSSSSRLSLTWMILSAQPIDCNHNSCNHIRSANILCASRNVGIGRLCLLLLLIIIIILLLLLLNSIIIIIIETIYQTTASAGRLMCPHKAISCALQLQSHQYPSESIKSIKIQQNQWNPSKSVKIHQNPSKSNKSIKINPNHTCVLLVLVLCSCGCDSPPLNVNDAERATDPSCKDPRARPVYQNTYIYIYIYKERER